MDETTVRERLGEVADPDLGGDLVSLGLVNAVSVDDEAEVVRVSLALGAPYAPTETEIAGRVREALSDLAYDVDLSASVPTAVDDADRR